MKKYNVAIIGLGVGEKVLKTLKNNKKINSIKIFSCGPHGMLRGVHQYSKLNNYECQIAVETIMACGIGICQGCTIIKKEIDAKHTYRNKYALACIDGPVFNGSEISDAF